MSHLLEDFSVVPAGGERFCEDEEEENHERDSSSA